jgi:acetoacetyl-CoA synthetase
MPNLIETAVAMLAATSLGATWCSCATDIGSAAAIERLGQVEPKVMITADIFCEIFGHVETCWAVESHP